MALPKRKVSFQKRKKIKIKVFDSKLSFNYLKPCRHSKSFKNIMLVSYKKSDRSYYRWVYSYFYKKIKKIEYKSISAGVLIKKKYSKRLSRLIKLGSKKNFFYIKRTLRSWVIFKKKKNKIVKKVNSLSKSIKKQIVFLSKKLLNVDAMGLWRFRTRGKKKMKKKPLAWQAKKKKWFISKNKKKKTKFFENEIKTPMSFYTNMDF